MKTRSMTKWCAAAALAAGVAAPGGAAGQGTAAPPDGAEFSADVTVQHSIIDARGTVVRSLAGSRYRLLKFAGGRLRLEMLPVVTSPAAGALSDAYAGMTVESDPGTGAIEVRDRRGKVISFGDRAGAAMAPAGDFLLLARASAHAQRRADLGRALGAPAGRVRGLLRHVVRQGSSIREVLVTPDTALPVEVNVVTDGALTEHHEYQYAALPEGAMVRRRTFSQSELPGRDGQRLVTVSTLRDIRVAGGAR